MRYIFADYELDEQLYELRHVGAPVELERKVFDVLTYLIQHRDRLVPKEELRDKLWPEQVVGEAALTRCITAARKALGDDGNRQEFIKTQHGRGYRFVAAVVAPVPRSEFQVPRQAEAISSQPSQVDNVSANTSELNGDRVVPTNAGIQASDTLGTARQQATSALSPIPSRSRRRLVLLVGLMLVIGAVITAEWRWVRSLTSPPPVSDSAALPLPDKPSIAILPFTNLSNDPQQEYFGIGITIDLQVALSKLSGLIVIDRFSTLPFKDQIVNVKEVSRTLGVRYIVEGSVRKVGDRLLITAQLLDGITGQEVWAERYDRLPQDLFAVQEEVRRKIVVQLGLKLTPEEEERLQQVYTPNLEAYNYLAHAKESYLRLTPADNAQARQLCEKAIALDPNYAVAYALLGFTYAQAWGNLWTQDPQALERVFEFAQKALTLDGSSPVAHELLGVAYLWRDHQLEQAIAEEEWAVAHSPNWFSAYMWLGFALNMAGRPEKTIALADIALRLSPAPPAHYLPILGNAYRMTRQYEKAIATYQQILTLIPHHPVARVGLATVYSELGREEEAQATMPEVLKQNAKISLEDVRLRLPYKDPAELERQLTALRKAGLK
jgi:adenylate cyclase